MRSVAKMIACLVAFSALCQALPAKVPSSGWQIYHNKDYGFTIAYPKDLTFYSGHLDSHEAGLSYIPICDRATVACFEYNGHAYEGTTFGAAGLSINVLRDLRTAEDCRKIDTGQFPIKQTIINGVRFHYGTTVDAGTSHVKDGPAYRTFREGVCFELAVGIASTNIAVYEPGTVRQFKASGLEKKLDAVVHTFKFVGPVVDGAAWRVYYSQCSGIFEYPDEDEVETGREYLGEGIFPNDVSCDDHFTHGGLNYMISATYGLKDESSLEAWLKASGHPSLSKAAVMTHTKYFNSYNAALTKSHTALRQRNPHDLSGLWRKAEAEVGHVKCAVRSHGHSRRKGEAGGDGGELFCSKANNITHSRSREAGRVAGLKEVGVVAVDHNPENRSDSGNNGGHSADIADAVTRGATRSDGKRIEVADVERAATACQHSGNDVSLGLGDIYETGHDAVGRDRIELSVVRLDSV